MVLRNVRANALDAICYWHMWYWPCSVKCCMHVVLQAAGLHNAQTIQDKSNYYCGSSMFPCTSCARLEYSSPSTEQVSEILYALLADSSTELRKLVS